MMTRIPSRSFQITNAALKLSSFASVVGHHHPTRRLSMMSITRTELLFETSSNSRENRPTALLQNFATATSSLFSSTRHYSTTTDVVDLKHSKFAPPPPQQSQEQYPPVIFLHGLLGNKRNFASLASSLSLQLHKPRTIYTLDLRNHGDNNHDWRLHMSYSDMARDVLAFIDNTIATTTTEMTNASESGGRTEQPQPQQQQQVVVVGHSMGGKVAQALALMYPERIAGLVVLDIAPVRYHASGKEGWRTIEEIVHSVSSINLDSTIDGNSGGGGNEMAQLQYKTKRDVDMALQKSTVILQDPALRAFVLTNLESVPSSSSPNNNDTEKQSTALLRWKINWEGIVNDIDKIAGFDVHDIDMDNDNNNDDVATTNNSNKPQYKGDVFFIHGGASRFVKMSHLSTISSYFPNHMLTTIRGSGHWVHAEAPDDTIALLKQYLDR
jgi:pimeloyl-ACP methyl ester carboxylesterase